MSQVIQAAPDPSHASNGLIQAGNGKGSGLDLAQIQPGGRKITREEFEEEMRILKNQQSAAGTGQVKTQPVVRPDLKNPLEEIKPRHVVGETEAKPVIPDVFLKKRARQ